MRLIIVNLSALLFATTCGSVFAQCEGGAQSPTTNGVRATQGNGVTVSNGTRSSQSASGFGVPSSFGGAGQAAFSNVPQFPAMGGGGNIGAVQAFQNQQMMNYRALAQSGVRNRTSPARHQQMLATNADRAYRAGMSAERAGRVYSAMKQYERAAQIAPGSLAAQYAEEAISRLSQ